MKPKEALSTVACICLILLMLAVIVPFFIKVFKSTCVVLDRINNTLAPSSTDEQSRMAGAGMPSRDVTYKIVVTDVVQAYIDGREVTVKELQREMNVDELPRIAEDGIAGTDTVNRILNLNGWEVK